MRTRKALAATAVVGATALMGGVFAATLANVSAPGFAAGQATLEATCLNPETANVVVEPNTIYMNGEYRSYEAMVYIEDFVNLPACDGVPMKVVAFGADGAPLAETSVLTEQYFIDAVSQLVGIPEVVTRNIAGWGVSLNGGPVIRTQPYVTYQLGNLVHWSKVDGATGYRILNGATTVFTTGVGGNNMANVNVFGLPDGTYSLDIVAVMPDESLSAPATFTLHIVNGVASFQ